MVLVSRRPKKKKDKEPKNSRHCIRPITLCLSHVLLSDEYTYLIFKLEQISWEKTNHSSYELALTKKKIRSTFTVFSCLSLDTFLVKSSWFSYIEGVTVRAKKINNDTKVFRYRLIMLRKKWLRLLALDSKLCNLVFFEDIAWELPSNLYTQTQRLNYWWGCQIKFNFSALC